MLEEPEYSDIVKWTASGDTFVVVEVRSLPSPTFPDRNNAQVFMQA